MKRLESLDALRGFDMLFLMGLNLVIVAISHVFGADDGFWLVRQMSHVEWEGFAQRDLIFPLFLFIAGVSFPFSMAKQEESGSSLCAMRVRIAKRMLMLLAFGLMYNGVLKKPVGDVVWGSVLGLIGFAWGVSALLATLCGWKKRVLIVLGIIAGYSALILSFRCPGNPDVSPLSMQGNVAGWLDRMVFPNAERSYYNQGILGHVSAICTAMFGVLAGEFVLKSRRSGDAKSLAMLLTGVAFLVAGYSFGLVLPVVKRMWSPTFVLVAGGYSLVLFAIFYWLIDVRGYWRHTLALRIVGMNAITIYFLRAIVDFGAIAGFFAGGPALLLPKAGAELLLAVAQLAISWGLLWFLYKRKIFLKI